MDDLGVNVEDGIGRILLTRPQAINALTSDMIDSLARILLDWAKDDDVHEVVISGLGRGFCAGADVREMREMILHERADPVDFLSGEYALDRLIATYPKPYTARMQGIVMGGGMGVSIHGSRRLVTGWTSLAMPETIIGLWPDVGLTYHLSRLPGELGTYMALTGSSITGQLATLVGLTDELFDDEVLDEEPMPYDWMAEAFAGNDIVTILERLESSDHPAAQQTAADIRARAPLSVVVTLEAIRRAASMTLDEVFAQDLGLGAFFAQWPDFIEGVRAQLVDKDFAPRWVHGSVEEVSTEEVRTAFGTTG